MFVVCDGPEVETACCLPVDAVYPYSGMFSAADRNGVLMPATPRMDLNAMLRERSQSLKVAYCMISCPQQERRRSQKVD